MATSSVKKASSNLSKAFGGSGSLNSAQKAAVAKAQAAFSPSSPKSSAKSEPSSARNALDYTVVPGNDAATAANKAKAQAYADKRGYSMADPNAGQEPTVTTDPTKVRNEALQQNAQQNNAGGAPAPSGIATDPVTGNQYVKNAQGIYTKYQQGLNALQNTPVPASAGAAMSAVSAAIPAEPDTSAVDQFTMGDTSIEGMWQMAQDFLAPMTQKDSLLSEYDRLYENSGIEKLDKEIIDAETIIDGTEDDIRNEVQQAGGFATDSQVQAMALSRNKGLLKRYNQLFAARESAQKRLDTMVQLSYQDRQLANDRITTQLNTMFKLADFQQQATNNVREGFNSLVKNVGYAGAYQAYAKDPRQLGFIEKVMGLNPGGLKALADYTPPMSETDQLDLENKRLQNQKLRMELGGKERSPLQAAHDASSIQQTKDLTNNSYLNTAVGPNPFARTSFLNVFTGGKDNFIANVEQLRNSLTLDNLSKAKANGTTFGSLTEGELGLVEQSGTKIGNWAVKDDSGKVVGYKANEKDFKNELDKINNFRKLDYLLKGGAPEDIDVIQTPDGKFWSQNWDGSLTELR